MGGDGEDFRLEREGRIDFVFVAGEEKVNEVVKVLEIDVVVDTPGFLLINMGFIDVELVGGGELADELDDGGLGSVRGDF